MYRSNVVLPVTLHDGAQPLPLALRRHRHADALTHPTFAMGSMPGATVDEMRSIMDLLNDEGDAATAEKRAADADLAEKRRKHRDAMVLFRLKKKHNFKDMKKQEQQLQDVLQTKLQQYHELVGHRHPTRALGSGDVDLKIKKLLGQFADVLSVKESLLRENRAMEGVINELVKYQKLVQDEVSRQDEDDSAESMSDTAKPKKAAKNAGEWVKFFAHEPPFYYEFITAEACSELVRDVFQRVLQLREGFVKRRFDIIETSCLGWYSQRSLSRGPQGSVLRFRFTREVPRWFMQLDDYRRAAWPAVTNPELNARLYSTPVHMKVLQFVDDDTFITLRNSPHKDRVIHLRYFAFNSRIEYHDDRNRRSFLIYHSILDLPAVTDPSAPSSPTLRRSDQPPVLWIKEGVQCMKFSEVEENDAIEIEFSGYMQCVSEEHAQYLMVEMGNILTRWEQLVVPPRMLRWE